MKTTTLHYFKQVAGDRLFMFLLILLCLAGVGYAIFVGLALRPSDLQVAVQYTAFGESSFYRDKWYYFFNFIAFGLLLLVVHAVLSVKVYLQGRRQLAIAFVLISLFLMLIAFLLTSSVLRVAFL